MAKKSPTGTIDSLASYLERQLTTKFPTVNPTLPTVVPDGTIIPSGKVFVPQEPGMGTGPGGTTPNSGGGGGGSGGDNPKTPLDWRAYLENWGFPADVVNELDRIFRTYPDSSAAGAAGLAYIRGTDWYKTTFPGIQEGIKTGVISDERGYRSYMNQLNDAYHRYFGRDVSGAEVAQFLGKGQAPGQVNAHFQGQAYIAANQGDIQYTLGAFDEKGQATPQELSALGDQRAGIDNVLGPVVQRRLQMAQQRFAGAFRGILASPALTLANGGRLSAPSLGGGINSSDVSA